MSDWPVGLSTGCFYRTSIFDCLEPIRNRGFGLLEICSFPAHLDYHNLAAVQEAQRRMADLGLEAYSFHAPFAERIDITALDAGRRSMAHDEIVRAADAAAALEVQYFVIHPGPEKGGFPEQERFARLHNAVEVLDSVSRICRQRGVALVLENMLPHLFCGHVRELLWILGALDTVEIGICLDSGHAHLAGDLRTVAHKLAGHLWMVHVSDNRGKYDDHLPAGDGEIDWPAFLAQLQRTGFTGTLMLEIAGQDDTQAILAGAQRGRRRLREISRHLRQSQLT